MNNPEAPDLPRTATAASGNRRATNPSSTEPPRPSMWPEKAQ
jgi:hypothetical protein